MPMVEKALSVFGTFCNIRGPLCCYHSTERLLFARDFSSCFSGLTNLPKNLTRCGYHHRPQLTDKVTVSLGLLSSKCQDRGGCVSHWLRGVVGEEGSGALSPQCTSDTRGRSRNKGDWGGGGLTCRIAEKTAWPGSQREVQATVTRRGSPASPWDGPVSVRLCARALGGNSHRSRAPGQQLWPVVSYVP